MTNTLFPTTSPTDHVAILNKKTCSIERIVWGQKEIESRRYVTKRAPWDRIFTGDWVYLKHSWCPVTAKVQVSEVLQFGNLTIDKIGDIVKKYGKRIDLQNTDYHSWWQWINYCTLIVLSEAQYVEPFNIKKDGFGTGAAWLVVGDIEKVKIKI